MYHMVIADMNYLPLGIPEDILAVIKYIRGAEPSNVEERKFYMDTFAKCSSDLHDCCFKNNKENIVFYGIDNLILDFYGTPVSTAQKQYVIQQYGYRCVICGFKISDFLMAHHIIPRHCGGNNNAGNLIPVCPICHNIIHISYTSVKELFPSPHTLFWSRPHHFLFK